MKKCFNGLVVLLALVFVVASAYGQTISTGRDLGLSFGNSEVDRVEFFDNFDLGGSIGAQTFFVYTETSPSFGTDTSTGGEIKALRYTEAIGIQINVTTLGSTSIDWQVEGRFGTATQYGLIGSGTISAANTVGEFINVTANPESIRVGLHPNTPGTDKVDVYGLFRRLKQ